MLTGRRYDLKLATALLEEKTVKAAAEAAGISERTAYRRMQSSEFQSLIDLNSIRILRYGHSRFLLAYPLAVDTTTDLLNAESASIRRLAAKDIIDSTHKSAELVLFASRIEELLGRVNELLQARKE